MNSHRESRGGAPRGLTSGGTLIFDSGDGGRSISTCIPANSLAKGVTVPSGPPIQISTRQQGEATILDLVGDITLFNSPEIRKVLILLLTDRGVAELFVNMTGVKYVDSSGIASLVEGLKDPRDRGSRIVLFGLSRPVRTGELTHLLRVFEVHASEQEALRAPSQGANKLAFPAGDGSGESA